MGPYQRMSWIVAAGVTSVVLISGCRGFADPEARAALMQSLGNTSFTVFPAFVRGEETSYDEDAARAIGEFLVGDGLAEAAVSEEEVAITGSWGSNEATMLEESAADFATHVQEHPLETDYALLAEYLIGGRGNPIGIHCYIVDADGRIAWARLWNSHHDAFAEATLNTSEDCTALLIQELREELEP